MNIDIKQKQSFIIGLLICLLIITMIYTISNNNTYKKYKELYQTEIDKIKKQKDAEIQKSIDKIKSLLEENKKKDEQIKKAYESLDSLQQIKNKVITKYVNKYKQIAKLNSKDINEYWENEFKD